MTASPAESSDKSTELLRQEVMESGRVRRNAAERMKVVASAALASTPLHGAPIYKPSPPRQDPMSSTEMRIDLKEAAEQCRASTAHAKQCADDAEVAASETRTTMIFSRSKLEAPGGGPRSSPTIGRATPGDTPLV